VYWAFRGHLNRPEKKQIAAIFRWIESHSDLLPRWSTFRMFPRARRFRLVRQSVTDPEPNPLFTGSRGGGA
jgi:hypothetical protein